MNKAEARALVAAYRADEYRRREAEREKVRVERLPEILRIIRDEAKAGELGCVLWTALRGGPIPGSPDVRQAIVDVLRDEPYGFGVEAHDYGIMVRWDVPGDSADVLVPA